VLRPALISSPRSDSDPVVPNDPVLPEAVPNNADGFNWQEEDANVDSLTDGMAALSVEPTGVGYLGKLSSYFILFSGMLNVMQAQHQVLCSCDVYLIGQASYTSHKHSLKYGVPSALRS